MNRPTQPCIYCGKPFRVYDSWLDDPNGKKYCSPKCGYAHRVEKKERTCGHCGQPFQAWGETSASKYCSKACGYSARRADVTCDHCQQVFNKQKCHVRAKNYCSPECLEKSAKERRSKYFPGICGECGGGTTRKEYKRCQSCKSKGAKPNGRPLTL